MNIYLDTSPDLKTLEKYENLVKNSSGYTKQIALGNLYVGLDHKKALELYTLASKTMDEQKCGDEYSKTDIMYKIGLCNILNGDYDAAFKILEPLLRTAYIKLDTRDQVIVLMAMIYSVRCDMDKSFELYNSLYNRVDPVISNVTRICLCEGLGGNYLVVLNYKDAIKYYKESIHFGSTSKIMHNNIGYCYEMRGNLTKALKYYKIALLKGSEFAPLNMWHLYTTNANLFSETEEEINKFYDLGKSSLDEWKKARKMI